MTLFKHYINNTPTHVRVLRTIQHSNGEIPEGTETRAIPDPLDRNEDYWRLEIPDSGKCLLVGEDAFEVIGEEDLIVVTYTESHPDRARHLVGVFTTEAKAQEAQDAHMRMEQRRLPDASIGSWNYTWDERVVDSLVW